MTLATLWTHYHTSPSELENMIPWEYEIYLNTLKNWVIKENEAKQRANHS